MNRKTSSSSDRDVFERERSKEISELSKLFRSLGNETTTTTATNEKTPPRPFLENSERKKPSNDVVVAPPSWRSPRPPSISLVDRAFSGDDSFEVSVNTETSVLSALLKDTADVSSSSIDREHLKTSLSKIRVAANLSSFRREGTATSLFQGVVVDAMVTKKANSASPVPIDPNVLSRFSRKLLSRKRRKRTPLRERGVSPRWLLSFVKSGKLSELCPNLGRATKPERWRLKGRASISASRDSFNTASLVDLIVRPLTSIYGTCLWDLIPIEHVGTPNVFASYSWQYSIEDLLQARVSDISSSERQHDYVWIDFVAVSQHQGSETNRADVSGIGDVVASVGHTILFLDPTAYGTYASPISHDTPSSFLSLSRTYLIVILVRACALRRTHSVESCVGLLRDRSKHIFGDHVPGVDGSKQRSSRVGGRRRRRRHRDETRACPRRGWIVRVGGHPADSRRRSFRSAIASYRAGPSVRRRGSHTYWKFSS